MSAENSATTGRKFIAFRWNVKRFTPTNLSGDYAFLDRDPGLNPSQT
jgi:hypothetical protein